MGKIIYTAIASVDGYIEDATGNFDWAMPDPEVHSFVNDLERSIGTHLYGRRMYEVMAVWETLGVSGEVSPEEAEYAQIWRALDKVVFSSTLDAVTTTRTQLERRFDPDKVRTLKAGATKDISVSGPNLATSAFEAGLVDEYQLFLVPWLVGGGKQALLARVHQPMELLTQRSFASGIVYLHYRMKPGDGGER